MNRIKHLEIAGVDGARLESFYSDLFGWEINQRDIQGYAYADIATDGDFTAAIRHEPEGHAEIVLYVEVSDVDKSVDRAQMLGAKIRIPPMQVGELYFALITDPEGNPIGVTQAKS